MLCKFAAFNQGLFILLSHQMPLKNLSRNQALIPLHLAFGSPECNDKGNYSILLSWMSVRLLSSGRGHGSLVNFMHRSQTSVLPSELVFFTVLTFLCSSTKTSTSWSISGVLLFKAQVTHVSLPVILVYIKTIIRDKYTILCSKCTIIRDTWGTYRSSLHFLKFWPQNLSRVKNLVLTWLKRLLIKQLLKETDGNLNAWWESWGVIQLNCTDWRKGSVETWFASNNSRGRLFLFSHQKGAIIRGKAIIRGRLSFQIFLTGDRALNILFYHTKQ